MASLDQILDDFSYLEEWEDRYRYVIELGKALPDLPDADRTADNKVRGCASQVWLVTETGDEPDPVLTFRGDSDAHIVRGLVAIVLAIYSGKHASEIANLDALDIFRGIGMIEHLSAQRANGLRSMVNRIQNEARLAVLHKDIATGLENGASEPMNMNDILDEARVSREQFKA